MGFIDKIVLVVRKGVRKMIEGMQNYRNLDKLQEQAKHEWRPQTREQEVVEKGLTIHNIESFLTNALPKMDPTAAQKIAEVTPMRASDGPGGAMGTFASSLMQQAAHPPPPVVEFESNGLKFKVEGGVVFRKDWVEVTGNEEFKIEDGKIFHLEWQKIKE